MEATFAAGATVLRWHAHPDVWFVMIALLGGYFLALRVLAPGRLPVGAPTASRMQKASWVAGVALLWLGADWPLHELGEDYLFTAHMAQHTLFSLVAPPFLILGLPPWLIRSFIGSPRVARAARAVTRPIVGLLLFNAVIVFTHWPVVVDASLASEPIHFLLHCLLFGSATLMWWPVLSPVAELGHLSEPGKMLYLFLQSIVPTVPASFLTFSEKVFYSAYENAPRIWGISAIGDQRVAGLFMKLVGGFILWIWIAALFFRWNAKEQARDEGSLTWDDFERELEMWELRR